MSYPEDLLKQANHLARLDRKKPVQANLRRAISAAYYALFHLLICDAAKRFSPPEPKGLQQQWQRAFAHGAMKDICQKFASVNLPENLRPLLAAPLSKELIAIAKAFVSLQQARHDADYDLRQAFSRPDAINQIKKAENAFVAWKQIRRAPDAAVFLSALLLSKQWSR